MRARIERYRRVRRLPNEDYTVGCVILEDPFFLAESEWIPAPPDWKPNIVQGRTYDLSTTVGRRLWEQILEHRRLALVRSQLDPTAPIYGDPVLVRQRLGQGAFRLVVTDARRGVAR